MNKIDSNDILKEISFKDQVSIVVVTHNRVEFLEKLLNSLQRSMALVEPSFYKIILCLNGQDQRTKNFLKTNEFIKQHSPILIELETAVTPAEARNVAVLKVETNWICFLDDDVEVPESILFNFKKLLLAAPDVTVWGGPNLTPPDSTLVQKKVGWFLQNYLVTGPISQRYKSKMQLQDGGELQFSLCNMFIKTDDFKNIWFNTRLRTAEENELIYTFAKNNLKMKSSSLLYVWHYRRESFDGFLKQIRNYGYGRGQLIYNGSIGKKVLAMVFMSILIVTLIFFMVPIMPILFFIVWQIVIAYEYLNKFSKNNTNISELLMPSRLWTNYIYGIFCGYWQSARKPAQRMTSLNKAKPSW